MGFIEKWLIILAIGVALAAAGYVKGISHERGVQALKEVKILTRTVEVNKKVMVGQERISAAYEKGKAEYANKYESALAELDKTRAERDAKPAACDISPHDLGVLNSLRTTRRPDPDTGKPAATLPGAGSTPERTSGNSGESTTPRLN